MISVIKLNRRIASASIFGFTIDKLYHRKKLSSIILFEIDKSSKIGFYYIILFLSLAIYLQIKSDRKHSLDVKKIV